MTNAPRALVTNDDGISSEGLRRLALVARAAGLDVVVAAPAYESSGTSAGLTAVGSDGRVSVEQRHLADLNGVPTYAVTALPGYITLIATRGAFGPPPDLVLSGINRGTNTGNAILHSGTVGAALTAGSNGCRALAVSLEVGHTGDSGADDGPHWLSASRWTGRVLPWLVEADRPVVLNLNVPNRRADQVRGLRRAGLARFGSVQTNIAEVGEGHVTVSVSEIDAENDPGTDAVLVAEGYATLTPLQPICEATQCWLSALLEG